MVLVLVVVDLVILVVYTMVEGIRGNLGAEKIKNRENPMDTKGVSRSVCILVQWSVRFKPYFYSSSAFLPHFPNALIFHKSLLLTC